MVLSKYLISAALLIPAVLAVKTRESLEAMTYGQVKNYAKKIGVEEKFGDKKKFILKILAQESGAGSINSTRSTTKVTNVSNQVRSKPSPQRSRGAPSRSTSSKKGSLAALLAADESKQTRLYDEIGFEVSRQAAIRSKESGLVDKLTTAEKMSIAREKLTRVHTTRQAIKNAGNQKKAEAAMLLPLQTEFYEAVTAHIRNNELWSVKGGFWDVMGDKNCLKWRGFVIPSMVLSHSLWSGLLSQPKGNGYRKLFNKSEKKRALLNASQKKALEQLLYNNRPAATENMDKENFRKVREKHERQGLEGLELWESILNDPKFPLSYKSEALRQKRKFQKSGDGIKDVRATLSAMHRRTRQH